MLASRTREPHAFGASLAAMLLVVFASALASAQSSDTTASETWKSAAASAAAASSTSAGPTNLVPTPLDNVAATVPDTAEISPSSQQQPSSTASDSQTSADSQPSSESNDIAKYQEEQSGVPPQQLMQQQFDNDGELSTPFGMQLREARRTLKSGEEADGLLITTVEKGGPAATAGLHPYSHIVHDALTGAAMAGAMLPFGQAAILLIPVLDIMQVGESYDMIIGVDGSRVTNFLDFQDRMRDLQPGEIVYLSVVRNGKRLQVTLPVTANTLQANN
ncbi:MAG: PDZ domain-containing protein [Candidatus Binatus sp.]